MAHIIRRLRTTLQEHTALRVVVYGIAGIAFLFVFFLISLAAVNYTESTAFCSTCHGVMNPEVTTHRVSAHAHTDCGTCHIGPGVWPHVQAKLENIRYLWSYPLNLYDRPLPSPLNTMRPARETCEQCHWPDKFYPVSLATQYDYAGDESNSLTRTLLAVNVGGAEGAPEEQGPGVHWHVQNPVYYIATDEQRQDIPWIQVERDGKVTEFISTDANLTQEEIDQANKRRIDCMDCHNRATHIIQRPAEAIDEAMSMGDIADDLPFIEREGVTALEKTYASQEEAVAEIAAIADFYRTEYPDVYANRQADVAKAVESLHQIYERTHFPGMNAYWDSYPNNIGHTNFRGCFRCHDGKHLSADNEVIQLECNLCHSIPQVSEPGTPLPDISLAVKDEPESHHGTLWLAEHRYQFDASCVECHTVENPGGSDNSSFCSNSACHAREWKFVGLSAPEIRELVTPPRLPPTGEPAPIPHPITQNTDCRFLS